MSKSARSGSEVRPFRIDVPQTELTGSSRPGWRRLGLRTRFRGSGSDYGVSLERVNRLVKLWSSSYDWRAEASLNAHLSS